MSGADSRPPSQLLLLEPWPVRERVSLRARRVRVDVRPNGEVVLTVPRRVARADAWRFLEQSREWIERTRARRTEMLGWSVAAIALSGLSLAFYSVNASGPLWWIQVGLVVPALVCFLSAVVAALGELR